MQSFKELFDLTEKIERQNLVLAGAEDFEAVKAVATAEKKGLIKPFFVGKKEHILENIQNLEGKKTLKEYEIIDTENDSETAEKSVKLISNGEGTLLMKGLIKTAVLLKAVLNKDWGLRTGRLLSHIAVAETQTLKKIIAITDGGMNLRPDINEKRDIILNAVELMKSLGIKTPRVAPVAAVEVVNEKMPETTDAAILSKMNDRGQIKGCVVDGPLGLDNALSDFAAGVKKISGDVAGNADIILVPDIHSGNLLGKSVEYIGGGTIAGLLMGAAVPIVIVSRADRAEAKLTSIALGTINTARR